MSIEKKLNKIIIISSPSGAGKTTICKNLLKVHARRHPLKRLYVLDEESDTNTGNLNKSNAYHEFRRLSDANIQTLVSGAPNKFYEYKDFKNE